MLTFLKKWFLVILVVIGLVAFFYFDLYQYLTFETLKKYQHVARTWTDTHYFAAVGLYILIFTALIASTIPCATFMGIVGGFLFGAIAILYAVIGTTLGGFILYLAIRSSLGHILAARTTGWLKSMEKGFQENAFNYILMMRLVPIFPCWISNISAGVMNVPVKTFLAATVIGILPSTLVNVLLGRGIETIFAQNQTPSLNLILSPPILVPLIGLAIISMIPVFYKRFKK